MSKDAQQLWDAIVPMLVQRGVAKEIDAAALELLCFWWGRYQSLRRKRKESYQLDCRLAMASKQWQALAAKFGLTPADRARLEIPEGEDPSNPFEAFLKSRMSRN